MSKSTVLVTGGSAGLGLATAECIARDRERRVVIACRSMDRAVSTARSIAERTGNPSVEGRAVDLASLASVCELARTWRDPIDGLVLNAGVHIVTGRTETVDGFETTFAVNHLGHFLLANLLLPHLNDDGRVVFVASDTHDPERITFMPSPRFEDPMILARGGAGTPEAWATFGSPCLVSHEASPGSAGRRRYTTSKLCNVLTAYEMDRRLRSGELRGARERIAVNAFDPGFMPGTDLARDYGRFARFVTRNVLPLSTLVWPNANRVTTSARRLADVAVGASYAGITGRYVSRGRVMRSSRESYEQEKGRRLWDASLRMVGVAVGRAGRQ